MVFEPSAGTGVALGGENCDPGADVDDPQRARFNIDEATEDKRGAAADVTGSAGLPCGFAACTPTTRWVPKRYALHPPT
jgi:hypothetical protein